MNIVFTSCADFPNMSSSDVVLFDELTNRGHKVIGARWDGDQEPFRAADLILFRAHWDYHVKLSEFNRWLDRLDKIGNVVKNDTDVVRWNSTKRYLGDLKTAGLSVPETIFCSGTKGVRETFLELGWAKGVIKPPIGASGYMVDLVSLDDLDKWSAGKEEGQEWMVQEFVQGISNGEISMVFFGGKYSHSVVKIPVKGEFRTNSAYRSDVKRTYPSEDLITQGLKALSYLPSIPLYGRVDGVLDEDRGFILMELELNEPGLYLNYAPEMATLWADKIEAL